MNEIALLSKAKDALVPMLPSDLETKLAGLTDELQEHMPSGKFGALKPK